MMHSSKPVLRVNYPRIFFVCGLSLLSIGESDTDVNLKAMIILDLFYNECSISKQ
jgi:hypothetical protein